MQALLSSRNSLGRFSLLNAVIILEARLTEAIDQVLVQFGVPPLAQFLSLHHRENRPDSQQLLNRISRCPELAKLRIRDGEHQLCAPEARRVDLENQFQRPPVVTLAISVQHQR
jgi:hypothetical protein